jgi:hypothetical protein
VGGQQSLLQHSPSTNMVLWVQHRVPHFKTFLQ